MITIILADDHHVVRQGLRALLEAESDFQIVAEASNGVEASQQAESLRPDVLVVDLMMPDLNGMEVTRQVGERAPGTHVVVLSMHSDESYVMEALRAGAQAYVLKDSTAHDLVQAIRNVSAGHRYLSPPLTERAIEAYAEKAKAARVDPYETLTTREREVMHLVVEGHTNTEIATLLSVSPRTVESHRANLMRKLELRTQADLIRYALQSGIVPLEE
jgi:DNA-binding NarL/FixJ family response regulator